MGRAERYLAKEADVPINKDLNVDTHMSNSSYGFILSNNNKMWSILKNSVKEFFATEFDRVENKDGQVFKTFTGIDRTDDYWLLEEYIQFTEKFGNYDRIISHSAALTIGKFYENEFGISTVNEVKEEKKVVRYEPKEINLLGSSHRGRKPYSIL